MVVVALSLAAYYAYKTRSKIWRHGKPNITWDPPLVALHPQDVQDWVSWMLSVLLNPFHHLDE
jgi:occludin